LKRKRQRNKGKKARIKEICSVVFVDPAITKSEASNSIADCSTSVTGL